MCFTATKQTFFQSSAKARKVCRVQLTTWLFLPFPHYYEGEIAELQTNTTEAFSHLLPIWAKRGGKNARNSHEFLRQYELAVGCTTGPIP